jgi:hypothetical protein
MDENRDRLEELLRLRQRNNRVPAIVGAWVKMGASVSPLSAQRQTKIVARLRAAGFRSLPTLPLPSLEPLVLSVAEFSQSADMLVIIGWNVDEEPAMLLPVDALNRSVPHLRLIYPDGFVLIDQPAMSALVVDFDEEDRSAVYLERLSLGVGG